MRASTISKMIHVDRDVENFLRPVFPKRIERESFIEKCHRKKKTWLALLNAAWYIAIADGQEKVKRSRPPLRIIFLIALAEYIAKQRIGRRLKSFEAIQEFFTHISDRDENFILRTIRRSMISPRRYELTMPSILKILYNVRNGAVHGEDYFSFALMDRREKEKYGDTESFGIITSGYLGGRFRKISVSLDTKLTYEELRDVFRRTAIENIRSML